MGRCDQVSDDARHYVGEAEAAPEPVEEAGAGLALTHTPLVFPVPVA